MAAGRIAATVGPCRVNLVQMKKRKKKDLFAKNETKFQMSANDDAVEFDDVLSRLALLRQAQQQYYHEHIGVF
jgi:hypothetical protein